MNPFALATADAAVTSLGQSVGTYVSENAMAVITAVLPLALGVGGALLVIYIG
jgi:hypothetical protein